MLRLYRLIVLFGVAALAMSACGENQTAVIEPAATPNRLITLRPYTTPTPHAAVSIPAETVPAPQALPSPTPRTHIVRAGEDMGSISLQYGVSLSELIALNPQVDPRAMSIGTALVIPPAAESIPEKDVLPSPEPENLEINPPVCYPTLEQGLWCFSSATNPGEKTVENVELLFRVTAPQGETLEARANALLDRIPPGGSMPVSVYFPPPVSPNPATAVELVNALPSPDEDQRYLPVRLAEISTEIHPGGLTASVRGSVLLAADETAESSRVWVLLAAFNSAGEIIGIHRWEGAGTIGSQAGVNFETTIYSLAEEIARVEGLAEARP